MPIVLIDPKNSKAPAKAALSQEPIPCRSKPSPANFLLAGLARFSV